MEDIKKIEFKYSLKDIPLNNKKQYLTRMYDATTKFINRLRWKIFFHNNENNDQYERKEEDIYKSSRSAPACEELKAFENDLFNVIKKKFIYIYEHNLLCLFRLECLDCD